MGWLKYTFGPFQYEPDLEHRPFAKWGSFRETFYGSIGKFETCPWVFYVTNALKKCQGIVCVH